MPRGTEHGREKARHLFAAAPRQQADDDLARIKAEPPPRLVAAQFERKDVEQRVAHELDRYARALVELAFERQHGEDAAHAARHLAHAATPPSPELRPDGQEDRRAGPPARAGP